MKHVEQAAGYFKEGFSCSQSVLVPFAAEFGLDPELALKVATAFGSGMARTNATCGAVTGALMAIGLKHGRIRADDLETREEAYRCAAEFIEQFRQRNGALLCSELLGDTLSTPEGRARIEQSGVSAARCPQFVRDAAEIVAQLLL